jgi:putative transposase
VFVEGGIYHVYNRFARGADLFADPEEAIEFLEILRKARNRDGLTVFAWTLMSNHYHLAVRAGPVPLSRTMGYVQARFGQVYNRRHRSSGPRWQSRYKARLVEDPRYLDRLIVYIHLNPVVAGLVDDPAAYTFSGHRINVPGTSLNNYRLAVPGFGKLEGKGAGNSLIILRLTASQSAG